MNQAPLIFLPEGESPPLPGIPGIMVALDVVKDLRSRLGSDPLLLAVHAFPLEDAKETLGYRVVRPTAHRTHAADNMAGARNR